MIAEPPLRYTRIAIALHWIVAVLIIANVGLALSVDYLPDAYVRPVIDTHKSIGITVLGLVILRVLWRLGHRPPPLPARYPAWEHLAAHAGHALLYGLILALPLSGWMHDSAWKGAVANPTQWFHLFHWPAIAWIANQDPDTKETLHTLFGRIHTALGYGLYALLAVHIGAALKHQFIDKEPELQRMKF